MNRFLYICFFVFVLVLVVTTASSLRALSVFSRDQVELHKYAAILAASEPQRIFRDSQIKKLLNPLSFWLCKLNPGLLNTADSDLRSKNPNIAAICEDYERGVLELVQSYGLDADTFNNLSVEISNISSLRRNVKKQASFYKLSAILEPSLVSTVKVVKAKPKRIYNLDEKETIHKFTNALKEVEAERLEVRRALLIELGIKEFPKNMCHSSVLPAMAPCIQEACQQFPNTAIKIINKHGLDLEAFNLLLDKSKFNPTFRLRLFYNMKKAEKTNDRE